ncbi:MAG: hypothetical protein VYE40_11870 [Myxococcota bacterium]|jgi:hypothetical protein|nr:hypothetical protein [Myxococcota bacterium]
MNDAYLFLVVCNLAADDDRRRPFEEALGAFGELAPMLSTSWLLSVDAERADDEDITAGPLLEHLLDVVGEDLEIAVVEVDNIATYDIQDGGEELLDRLFPPVEYEEEE